MGVESCALRVPKPAKRRFFISARTISGSAEVLFYMLGRPPGLIAGR